MADRIARVWNGTSWEVITSTAAAQNAVVVYQSTAPSSPVTGQIWVDSDDRQFSIWDGSSWISAITTSTYQSASPSAPITGQVWIDSDDGIIYVWDGSSWAVSPNLSSYSSPTFDGVVTADNYDIGLTTLNSDSVALNFSSDTGLYTRSAAGTITFTGSNYRAGAIKSVRIIAGGSSRTLNFPTNWVFVGQKPSTINANKTGILTVTSFGTTEADCVAAWAVQS